MIEVDPLDDIFLADILQAEVDADSRRPLVLLDQVTAESGPAAIALPYEKALIANRLGMQPESFSRALARLRDLGVTVERDNVHIKDLAKLIAFSARSKSFAGRAYRRKFTHARRVT